MSKCRESEDFVGRCLSKKVLSKISQITQKKHSCWTFPTIKLQALKPIALLKGDCNTGTPSLLHNLRNLQEHSSLQNTSNDGSFWREPKYDFSLKVRGQLLYSRATTGGIT